MTDFKDTVQVLDSNGKATISLRADHAVMSASGGDGGEIFLGDKDGHHRIGLNATNGSIFIREPKTSSEVLGPVSVSLNGTTRTFKLAVDNQTRVLLEPTGDCGRLRIYDKDGHALAYLGDVDGFATLALGGTHGLFPGRIALRKGSSEDQIVLDANSGDILLMNADCAEEFDVAEEVEPGTVLVLDDQPGRLRTSELAYDSKVAGVVSGAGAYRPGIVLDRQGDREGRQPVALVGKVFCKVDATSAPVRPGSLLTTAATPGHAMAAVDRDRAFGAVLGKALQGLERGFGLVPVLVGLQ